MTVSTSNQIYMDIFFFQQSNALAILEQMSEKEMYIKQGQFNRPTPKMRELIIVHMVFQLNNIFGIICNVIIPSCRCTDRSMYTKWCWLPRVHFSRRSSKIKNSHQIQSPLEYSGWRMYVSQEAMVNFINFSTLDTLLWIFHLFPELLKFISATTFHVEKLSKLCHVGLMNHDTMQRWLKCYP